MCQSKNLVILVDQTLPDFKPDVVCRSFSIDTPLVVVGFLALAQSIIGYFAPQGRNSAFEFAKCMCERMNYFNRRTGLFLDSTRTVQAQDIRENDTILITLCQKPDEIVQMLNTKWPLLIARMEILNGR